MCVKCMAQFEMDVCCFVVVEIHVTCVSTPHLNSFRQTLSEQMLFATIVEFIATCVHCLTLYIASTCTYHQAYTDFNDVGIHNIALLLVHTSDLFLKVHTCNHEANPISDWDEIK